MCYRTATLGCHRHTKVMVILNNQVKVMVATRGSCISNSSKCTA